MHPDPSPAPDEPYAGHFDESARVLVVTGLLDELAAEEFREDVRRCSQDHTEKLHLDLAGVDFMTSVSLGVIAGAMRAAGRNGTSLTVSATAGSFAQRVLDISGLPYERR